MRQTGLVVDVKDRTVTVKVTRESACATCSSNCACGKTGTGDAKTMLFQAINEVGAMPGDTVEVDMDTPDVLGAAFIMYTLPLLGLLGGLAVGWYFIKPVTLGQQLMTFLLGIAGTAGVFLLIRANDSRFKDSRRFQPVITKRFGKTIL